ncbi:DUF11 domain-containing protein [Shimazuella kribbensis]|uniref:DUF11 domain-containing protein n=1 Tax=Shimazuella kribbensis TaxID=139808 RepID=UPI00040248E8|nr:DUF11 domain-containing protein [Shimazuella kribbensis]
MPFYQRFTKTTNGQLTFTGNSLGYSDGGNDIGAFITIDTSKQVSGYPAGSTMNWQENSSSAVLRMVDDAEVLYAELMWGGSTNSDSENVVGSLNSAVTFTTPTGIFTISPDPLTAREEPAAYGQVFYSRSANVTSLVQAAGAGVYTTGGVPGTVRPKTGATNAAGWTLAVAYKHPGLKIRNMNIYAGSQLIDRNNPPVDEILSGFMTLEAGEIKGRVMLTAMEGDSDILGDRFEFGPDTSSLSVIAGPNNSVSNFFAAQINDDDGYLDTSGTAGVLNQPSGSDVFGRRSGWDITNVDVSSTLQNSQGQAVVRIATAGDTYMVSGYGVQLDANSPIVKMTKSADKEKAVVGEIVTYTLEVKNEGFVPATNIIFQDFLDPELEYLPDSLRVRGVSFPGEDIAAGVNVGTIAVGETIIITYQAKIIKEPPSKVVHNKASMTFDFQSRPDLPISTATSVSNVPGVEVIEPPLCEESKNEIIKTVAEAEKGIAHIIRAEAEKVEMVSRAFQDDAVLIRDLIAVNDSVEQMLDAVIELEEKLINKLSTVKGVCDYC